MTSCRNFVLALFVSAVFASQASAQVPSGFKTFEHKRTSLRLYYPKYFKAVPVQPTERLVIANFTRQKVYREKEGRGRRPATIQIFVLEDRTTPQAGEEDKDGEPTTVEELVEKQNAIHFHRDFMKQRHRGWSLKKIAENRSKGETEYRLEHEHWRSRSGYLYVRVGRGKTFGVVGFADEVVMKTMEKRFRKVGKSIHKPTGYRSVKDDSDRIYKGKDYRDIPFRKKARAEMIKGWKCFDTENFFIVYHTKNMGMIRKVANDLEAIRPLYLELFPPTKPMEAVSVVRVCKDRDEYHQYGGPRGSAGYWNFVAKELVLYDFTYLPKDAGTDFKTGSDKDSYIVLYHEAFHQYIFYAAGEVSPHDWFNEGNGDYFSGVTIYKGTKKIKGVGLNRWRLPFVKRLNESDRFIPLEKLLNAERKLFYNPRLAGMMYAEAWSFIYFLRHAKVVKKHQEWQGIIDNYFVALKEGHAKYVGALPEGTPLKDRREAEKTARNHALRESLKGIDLEPLEEEWRKWLKKVKNPWPSRRR